MVLELHEILAAGKFQPLRAHASTKKFYLGEWEGKKSLLIDFEDGKEERNYFLKLTELLIKNKISVPNIVYVPNHDSSFLITQFIDGDLISKTPFSNKILEKIIEQAEQFTLIKKDHLTGLNIKSLDFMRLKYEFDFFLLHFCENFANDKIDNNIRKEIYNFAEEIDSFPKSFCHRDYHSENIISLKEDIFILDYQDALLAPRTYDYASLYVDGYYDFPGYAREEIRNRAVKYFGATQREFLKTALQRALKALGTFGFQIVHRKKARYIASVKRTVTYLDEFLEEDVVKNDTLRNYLRTLQNRLTLELCG